MCPPQVRRQLEAVDGVEGCAVDYAAGTATCKVKAGTDPDDVAKGLSGPYSGEVKQ